MSAKRERGNGEGSVYPTGCGSCSTCRREDDGRWVESCRWTASWFEFGRRRKASAATKADAKKVLREALRRVDEGRPGVDSSVTFGAWAKRWRDEVLPHARRNGKHGRGRVLAESSIAAYGSAIVRHVEPVLGKRQLCDITTLDVQSVLDRMDKRGLSPSYQNTVHKALGRLFNDAVRARLIARSPMGDVTPPERRTVRAKVIPTRSQVAQMIDGAGDDGRTRVLIVLMAYTGCRIGEALTATWSGYDVEAARLHVVGKTGPRDVPVTPTLARELAAWKVTQAAERLRSVWWGDPDLIVSTECGTQWDASNARRRWRAISSQVCPGAVPHSLRHAAATYLLEEGVDVRVVSALLGHSSTKVTQDVYQHVTPMLQDAAGEALERTLSGA